MDTWTSAKAELGENIAYCAANGIPICTINFRVYLQRMEGFAAFLADVREDYPLAAYTVTPYYDSFLAREGRKGGHFMYYNITITVPLR